MSGPASESGPGGAAGRAPDRAPDRALVPESEPEPSSGPPSAAAVRAATDRLRATLARPATWGVFGADAGDVTGRGEPARVLETHGAVLGFAGDRVLKVKKPVDLGFFDFTTPERRRHFVREEVRLNRRLAGRIYLGVAPILERDGELVAGAPREPADALPTGAESDGGVVVDHAVAMVRLPEEGMLGRRLEAGTVTDEDLVRIARRIARFHASARRDERTAALARPATVRRELLENADQLGERLRGGAADAMTPARLARVRRWLTERLDALAPVLDARVDAGRACEGHGDLHGGNLCLLGPGEDDVVAFDCIEFEEAYRCGDPAREMGFLAMDLDARGGRWAADRLLAAYAEAAGDPDLPGLVDPFVVHYALVRAKIAAITAEDAAASGDDGARRTQLADLRRYGEIAVRVAAGPAVVLMCGLPGTGKSWLGGLIAERLRARTIRSDVERKRLFGIEPTDRTPESQRDAVYSAEATRRTYDRLIEGAEAAIRDRRDVVLDATYGRRAERDRAVAAIERAGGIWVLVHADPPPDVVRQWLAERTGDAAEVSDADLAVHERARADFEPPEEVPAARRVTMREPEDAEGVPAAVLAALERTLGDPEA